MPEGNALHDQLNRLFAEKLHLEIPSSDTDLFETGGLDSMAFIELLLQLEHEFGISVSFEDIDIDNFRSIEGIAAFLLASDSKTVPPAPQDSASSVVTARREN